jgi:hypothetical protein
LFNNLTGGSGVFGIIPSLFIEFIAILFMRLKLTDFLNLNVSACQKMALKTL